MRTGTKKAPPLQDGILRFLLPTAVAAFTFALYAVTAGYDFVFDDKPLLDFIVKLAGEGGVGGILKADFRALSYWTSGYYRPVTLLSLYTDLLLSGTSPVMFHLSNIFFNTANSLLVFFLALKLTGNRWAALIGGALFAVHPSHVETAAFISGRADLLASFFSLLAALFWWKTAREDGGRKWAAFCSLSIAMAVFSKESGLMVPVALTAFEVLLPAGKGKEPLAKRLARWAPEVAGGVLLALAVRFLWAGVPFGSGDYLPIFPDGSTMKDHPALFMGVWFHYIYLSLAGWPLSSFYSPEKVFPTALNVAASVVVLGLFFGFRKKLREHLALFTWFAIFILPVSGLMPRMGAVVADRFLYLSSAATAILFGWLAWTAISKGGAQAKAAMLAVLAMFLLHGTISAARIPTWKNDLALFTRMVVDEPNLTVGYTGIGQELYKAGRFQEAAQYFEKAIAIDRGNYIAYKFLSYVYRNLGRAADADRAAHLGNLYQPPWSK